MVTIRKNTPRELLEIALPFHKILKAQVRASWALQDQEQTHTEQCQLFVDKIWKVTNEVNVRFAQVNTPLRSILRLDSVSHHLLALSGLHAKRVKSQDASQGGVHLSNGCYRSSEGGVHLSNGRASQGGVPGGCGPH
jgi:hypothetical protein